MVPLDLPPLLKVINREEVIFRGCVPEPIMEPRPATWPAMIRQVGPHTMIMKRVWHTLTGACMNKFGAWGPFIDWAQAGSRSLFSKKKQ
jgi:hypothetical protein